MDALTLTFQTIGRFKDTGHATHVVGTMTIVTSPLAFRPGCYLTAVMEDRLPVDAEVSESMEDAVLRHVSFVVAADKYQGVNFTEGLDDVMPREAMN